MQLLTYAIQLSHQARGHLKGTSLERARASARAKNTADVLYVEQDTAAEVSFDKF